MSKEPWELLADTGIKEYLTNTKERLSDEFIRIILLELFRRLNILETENHTLKTLLFLQDCLDEETFKATRDTIQDFLKEKDQERAQEAVFWSASGVPFTDWVNFVTKGRFESSH